MELGKLTDRKMNTGLRYIGYDCSYQSSGRGGRGESSSVLLRRSIVVTTLILIFRRGEDHDIDFLAERIIVLFLILWINLIFIILHIIFIWPDIAGVDEAERVVSICSGFCFDLDLELVIPEPAEL